MKDEDDIVKGFEEYGYAPEICPGYAYYAEQHCNSGWIMFSPQQARDLLEEVWMYRDLRK